MKILITAPKYFDNEVVNIFKQIGEVTIKEDLDNIAEYDVIVIRVNTKVDKNFLDKAMNLKVIGSATIGLDHIDVDYAKEKAIEIISLQGANTSPTAEHVFALLLSLVRKVNSAQISLINGGWNREMFFGTQLEGKKLGIVGYGRIGQHVGKIAKGFGMELLAYDPYLPDDKFSDAKKMELDELLQEADFVTLHMFLSDETSGMFNINKFKLMKKESFLINCSRGAVINDNDLVKALKQKIISGAGLDVFCEEPLPEDNILFKYAKKHDNLILTPHLGALTKEAVHEAGVSIAEKIKEFLEK